jgi:glutamyl-tRNA synthetase
MHDVKLGKLAQPLRVALTGQAASPGIGVTLALVGRERALQRIDRAIEYIGQRAGA